MSKDKVWMPLYIGDFIADTMHLGATETGIYIRLIMHCWQHGTVPRNDKQLALISHCDSRLWHQYRTQILPFFDVVDASTMQHRRVSTELRRCKELSNKRKAAALQKHSKRSANAEQLHPQSQSHLQRVASSSQSLEPARAWRIAIADAFKEAGYEFPPDTGYAAQWAVDGLDLTVCLTVIKGCLARAQNKNISSLRYFQKAIEEAHAKRKANGHAHAEEEPQEVVWRRMFDFWKRTEMWLNWGPRPDEPGCQIPKHLIEEWSNV